ncbi:MAG: hypothetical protein JXR89_08350 [Deltaproteobacteria bacterium]|nr:hypothetical protein [Deltaproteobacteria bacterium]
MNPTSAYRCPVSQLPIISRPEWNKVGFGTDFYISADIIGEQIIVTHNYGSPSLHDVRNAMNFTDHLINSCFQGRPYIHIFDYTEIKKNVCLEGRRQVIKGLKQRRNMLAAIYYGLSPALKLSVRIGCFFNITPFICLITRDYSEAVNSALSLCRENSQKERLVEKSKALERETELFIRRLGSRNPAEQNLPEPFGLALDIVEDDIRYWDERDEKTRHQETMARLQRIISKRNEKAMAYHQSLRPHPKD